MKKNLLNIAGGALMLLLCSSANAQVLNGVYTIDNTIAASATNFTSFTTFAARVNGFGVSGPVTVNVGITSGPYNEQVNFNQATGISATNSITINGNGRTISFNATSGAPHTILLSGADYMTFNNLKIDGLSTTALTVHLWNIANYNQFFNCVITCPVNGTSSTQVPFSMSGSGTSATTFGDHGNFNTVNTCTISGGYYNVMYYGNTNSPFSTDNKVLNSYLVDWYLYGLYSYYDRNMLVSNNVVERLNRTSLTTTYGFYFQGGNQACIVERNHFRRMFDLAQTNGNQLQCIYMTSGVAGQENIIRNNLISDNKFSGTFYGIYLAGTYIFADHNTISMDDLTSTGSTTYAMYLQGQYCKMRNNIITIRRASSSTTANRYGIYCSSNTYLVGLQSSNNVFYINGTPGNNYVAYMAPTNYPTLASWQAATNQDLNSINADPLYTNPTAGNYVPTSTVINNTAGPIGVVDDFTGAQRSLVMPDPGAFEFYNTPCNSGPGITNLSVPNQAICPGNTVSLVLGSNTFTNSGYSVQWYSSTTSSTSGFTGISGATLNTFNSSPINVNTYYNAVITCVNSSQSSTTTVGSVLIAPPTASTVPYFESFETLAYNVLPNCSWSSTQNNLWPNSTAANYLQSNNRVPRTGNGYAVFTGTPVGTNYFYSNGIQMLPGITYSASIWYINELLNYNPWSDLAILVGTAQATGGQQMIASTNGPAASVVYSPVTNTFVVSAPGVYYIAIRATSATGSSPFLTWDDLSITIPCQFNEPAITIFSTKDSICSGETVNLLANGGNTYSWSTSASTTQISVSPNSTTLYSVLGTSSVTGCSKTVNKLITVNLPVTISAVAFPVVVCAGSPANLVAVGTNISNYYWSNGSTANATMVLPLANSVYSVTGTSADNCKATATLQVSTNPLPVLTVTMSKPSICRGEAVSLNVSGAGTYSWVASTSGFIFNGSQVTDYPTASTIYSVTGIDANGCINKTAQPVSVDACSGIGESTNSNAITVFPNPTNSSLFLDVKNDQVYSFEVSDISGRIILTSGVNEKNSVIEMQPYANGVYYLKVQTEKSVEVIRIIKN